MNKAGANVPLIVAGPAMVSSQPVPHEVHPHGHSPTVGLETMGIAASP